jgi:phosphoribosylaminoimidazole-succinocarboxamide synthase
MQKIKKIYEGKAKQLYSTADENLLIQYFKDDATAFNGEKKAVISDKGILNNLISEFIMIELEKASISTHFIKRINDREQLIKKVKIIPLEIIIRNFIAGSIAKRLGIAEGEKIENAIFEICYKDDSLNDPLINEDHAVNVLKIIDEKQYQLIKKTALKINQILTKIFDNINIKLIDFKIEFGFDVDNNIILADEISPDSCRLWDKETSQKLDKDIFRRDLGDLVSSYKEVAKRLGIMALS